MLRNDAIHTSVLSVEIQDMSKWEERGDVITAFFDSDPENINALGIADFAAMKRDLFVYREVASDVEGCVDLCDGVRAQPTMALTDPSCPTLLILDALRPMGWLAVNRTVIHQLVDGVPTPYFDVRKCPSSKTYFQALLNIKPILEKNTTMHSNEVQAYYELVMKGETVERGTSAKECRKRMTILDAPAAAVAMKDSDDLATVVGVALPEPLEESPPRVAIADVASDDEFCVSGGACPATRVEEKKPARKRARGAGGRGRGRGSGDPPVIVPPALPEPPSSSSDSSSSSNSNSSSSSRSDSDSGSSDEFAVSGVVKGWIDVPFGPSFKEDAYTPRKGVHYQRWIVRCTHHGGNCMKKRNQTQTKNFGDAEPLAFLYAWNDMGATMTKEAHCKRGLTPTLAAVRAWVDNFPPEFIRNHVKT